MTVDQLKAIIRDIPDFPKPGILFKDITPALSDPKAFKALVEHFAQRIPPGTTKLVAIESRGFILGAALALRCELGLVIARKPGKLPWKTVTASYQLEYGKDTLEMHDDALMTHDKVLIVDDVLATGGTAQAVYELCEQLGAEVLGGLFLMEIPFLKGRHKFKAPVESLFEV